MNNLHIIVDELIVMQLRLEQNVNSRFNILQPRDYIQEKLLALKVELGELANETVCFKYWSVKDQAARSVILEEYVDCIHHLLGIGLVCGDLLGSDIGKRLYYGNDYGPGFIASPGKLTEQFNRVFRSVINFEVANSFAHYLCLFQELLNLGHLIGFDEQEIYEGYVLKNQKNLERQREGY